MTMDISHAQAIVGAICNASFAAMGFRYIDTGIDLSTVSLAEMIEAVKLVNEDNDKPGTGGTKTIHVVPDERLVAAVFALAHYEPGGPIAAIGNKFIGVSGRL